MCRVLVCWLACWPAGVDVLYNRGLKEYWVRESKTEHSANTPTYTLAINKRDGRFGARLVSFSEHYQKLYRCSRPLRSHKNGSQLFFVTDLKQ